MWYSVKDKYPKVTEKDGSSDIVLCVTRKFGFNNEDNSNDTYELLWWSEPTKTWESFKIDDFDNNADYYQVIGWMEIPNHIKKHGNFFTF